MQAFLQYMQTHSCEESMQGYTLNDLGNDRPRLDSTLAWTVTTIPEANKNFCADRYVDKTSPAGGWRLTAKVRIARVGLSLE